MANDDLYIQHEGQMSPKASRVKGLRSGDGALHTL